MHHADGGGRNTGTKDKNHEPIWFAEQCLSDALRLDTYRADAEEAGDTEPADLFRQGAERQHEGGGARRGPAGTASRRPLTHPSAAARRTLRKAEPCSITPRTASP